MDRSRLAKATISLVASLCAGLAAGGELPTTAKRVPTTRRSPDEFGTQDYTVTTIWAGSFGMQRNWGSFPNYGIALDALSIVFTSSSGGCIGSGQLGDMYATANIPSGAIIDYIGIETKTDAFAAWGLELVLLGRNDDAYSVIGSVNSTVHGWDTDYNVTPLGFQLTRNVHNALIAHVQQAGDDQSCSYFRWVEIWWRRPVSPAPDLPSFNDVPTTDFGYQYIEALAASGITGGCGGGAYCPDAPLTRRQMAIFLAKALGLHWPY